VSAPHPFATWFNRQPRVLVEGSMIERLKVQEGVRLHPELMHALMPIQPDQAGLLESVYTSYMDVAEKHGLPYLLFTPTRRASGDRCRRAGHSCMDLNQAGVHFVREILRTRPGLEARLGGFLGCRGDAYQPAEALSVEEAMAFHAEQVEALASSGVDFLMSSTHPALTEAEGIGHLLAGTGHPYLLSFVIRRSGRILDGTLLEEAMAHLDSVLDPKPLGYWINCVHPENVWEASGTLSPWGLTRILGLQGNTSALSPEELEAAHGLQGAPPKAFASAMLQAGERLGLRALGGCCGTDERHISALARAIQARPGHPRTPPSETGPTSVFNFPHPRK